VKRYNNNSGADTDIFKKLKMNISRILSKRHEIAKYTTSIKSSAIRYEITNNINPPITVFSP
jgi:hypothetical protein